MIGSRAGTLTSTIAQRRKTLDSILLSNVAKITNVGAVEQILDGYDSYIEFDLRPEESGQRGTLQVSPDDEWPRALKDSLVPDRDDFEDDESWLEAIDEASAKESDRGQCQGDEGFVCLLQEIAPYLETPLRIFHVCVYKCHDHREWTVRPGATEVLVTDVDMDEVSVTEVVLT